MAVAVSAADIPPENIRDVPHDAVNSCFDVPFAQIATVVSVFSLTW